MVTLSWRDRFCRSEVLLLLVVVVVVVVVVVMVVDEDREHQADHQTAGGPV